MRLENERLCVEIAELGAEVLRIDVQEHGSDQWNAVSNVTARFRTGQHLQMHQFHERFCVLPACLQR